LTVGRIRTTWALGRELEQSVAHPGQGKIKSGRLLVSLKAFPCPQDALGPMLREMAYGLRTPTNSTDFSEVPRCHVCRGQIWPEDAFTRDDSGFVHLDCIDV
jgi:hypothetical protein